MWDKWKATLAATVTAIVVTLAVVAAVLDQPAHIERSVSGLSKFVSFTFGQAPASISIRDVRPGSSTPPRADAFQSEYIGAAVESVATNKGDQPATNCKGELSFSNKYGDVYYEDDKTKVNDEGWKDRPDIGIIGGNIDVKIGFHFSVPPNVYNKEANFRVMCDRILTKLVPITFQEFVGGVISNGG